MNEFKVWLDAQQNHAGQWSMSARNVLQSTNRTALMLDSCISNNYYKGYKYCFLIILLCFAVQGDDSSGHNGRPRTTDNCWQQPADDVQIMAFEQRCRGKVVSRLHNNVLNLIPFPSIVAMAWPPCLGDDATRVTNVLASLWSSKIYLTGIGCIKICTDFNIYSIVLYLYICIAPSQFTPIRSSSTYVPRRRRAIVCEELAQGPYTQ